jgi:hypothetical protein
MLPVTKEEPSPSIGELNNEMIPIEGGDILLVQQR